MLRGDFYEITHLSHNQDGSMLAGIEINKGHEIFNGHFPGFPVVPGVCMIQIIKEVAAEITGLKLILSKGDNIKFLRLINPDLDPSLMIRIQHKEQNDGLIKTEARIYNQEYTFLKFKGQFSIDHTH
ncbi:MAG: hydroxymyristoyl-ACP dehydratase [Bacteroidales bacterium]